MEKEKYIERIREACIKANPDILKLEFGCEVIYQWENEEDERMTVAGIFGYEIALSSGVSWIEDARKEDILEILGRPIRLADVLVAIDHVRPEKQTWFIRYDGKFYNEREDRGYRWPHISWNLRADRLEDQSIECLKFISELLP